jgi:hypothetical protein
MQQLYVGREPREKEPETSRLTISWSVHTARFSFLAEVLSSHQILPELGDKVQTASYFFRRRPLSSRKAGAYFSSCAGSPRISVAPIFAFRSRLTRSFMLTTCPMPSSSFKIPHKLLKLKLYAGTVVPLRQLQQQNSETDADRWSLVVTASEKF